MVYCAGDSVASVINLYNKYRNVFPSTTELTKGNDSASTLNSAGTPVCHTVVANHFIHTNISHVIKQPMYGNAHLPLNEEYSSFSEIYLKTNNSNFEANFKGIFDGNSSLVYSECNFTNTQEFFFDLCHRLLNDPIRQGTSFPAWAIDEV